MRILVDFTESSNLQLERAFQDLQANGPSQPTLDLLQKTIHELQVHRNELETQNRTMREAQPDLEHTLHRPINIYDSLPIGYVTLSAQGQIAEANLTAAEWLNVPREQLTAKFFVGFVDPADRMQFSNFLQECVRVDNRVNFETVLIGKNGASLPVQLAGRGVPGPRRSEGPLRVAITDVAEIKRTQHLLEEINEEQEQFAYSISHDLRAPLLTISNFAMLLTEDYAEGLNDPAREIVGRMRDSALRMEELLKNLLQYSRVSREQLKLETIDLGELLRDVLTQHRGMIQELQAEVAVQQPLASVRGSRILLAQAVANLLTNAFKYTELNQNPIVHVYAEERPHTVALVVEDKGIGIAPEFHEKIFRIFERLHGRRRYPGTGLGLAIVHRAVTRMGGSVWVESSPGRGSRFYIELPKEGR